MKGRFGRVTNKTLLIRDADTTLAGKGRPMKLLSLMSGVGPVWIECPRFSIKDLRRLYDKSYSS